MNWVVLMGRATWVLMSLVTRVGPLLLRRGGIIALPLEVYIYPNLWLGFTHDSLFSSCGTSFLEIFSLPSSTILSRSVFHHEDRSLLVEASSSHAIGVCCCSLVVDVTSGDVFGFYFSIQFVCIFRFLFLFISIVEDLYISEFID